MDPVTDLIERMAGRRTVALVGAGCSTASGIPDYRGPETRRRARNPVQHRQFVESPDARRRYWARSLVGWPTMAEARPNAAHQALAALERTGHLTGTITQNVDGLHHRAGQREVVELHGALRRVVCLACGQLSSRNVLQRRLLAANPTATAERIELAPDGDAELEPDAGFVVVPCDACGGVLMPDVVFFGGTVPRDRVDRCHAWVDDADLLLVIGSSLTVFSGYRFVKRAAAAGIPVAILNLGPTRGDPLAQLRLDARVDEVLPRVAAALAGPEPA